MNTSEGATRVDGSAGADVAAATITLPPWLVRGWARVTSDPVAVMSWLFAIVGILAVSTEIYWDSIAPCGQGYCATRGTYNPLSLERWMRANLDHGFYLQAGRVWAIASTVAAITALVLAARGSRYLAIATAALPILSVPLFGSYLIITLISLTVVTWILALRDPLAGLIPGVLALGIIWLVMPFAFRYATFGIREPYGYGNLPSLGAFTAYVTVGYVLAISLRAWFASRTKAIEARQATAKAELAEQSAVATETRAAERARLARDLHDVVAHHISLVAVRAESAPYTHPDLDPAAREVLAEIATDARSALTELRQVLTVLQRTESPDLAPQPGATDVESLIAEARSAGQSIEEAGDWDEVPAAVGYVLFRAAQEGLTNARRHAPGLPSRLVRLQQPGLVALTLTNPLPDGASHLPQPGRGLIGMRERVEALGGTFAATVADEKFVLSLSLPVEVLGADTPNPEANEQ